MRKLWHTDLIHVSYILTWNVGCWKIIMSQKIKDKIQIFQNSVRFTQILEFLLFLRFRLKSKMRPKVQLPKFPLNAGAWPHINFFKDSQPFLYSAHKGLVHDFFFFISFYKRIPSKNGKNPNFTKKSIIWRVKKTTKTLLSH